MTEIVLSTLNAKYIHAAFGLRYLMANLGALRSRARIVEFDINQRPIDIVERILANQPKIVGLGVYIWNVEQTQKVVADIKRIAPETIIVLGGPEVSYETDQQEICRLADYVITGEADIAFRDVCESLLAGRRPLLRIIPADLPEFASNARSGAIADNRLIQLPYDLYDDHDIHSRVLYVEASRGCPFKCEFCLSSLDVPLRNAEVDAFLSHMQRLLDRGARQFKFVDRTFNLNLNISRKIMDFFHERYVDGLFLHFEMIPDRLPDSLRQSIARFPAGALQFEVGVQTLNPEVEERISRKQDQDKLVDNLRWLREETGVHIHTDLIVGLPGEDIASFGRGFDRLVALRPQEIQVGILKRLRGTPIIRHDAEFGMVYSPHPPYEILQTSAVNFASMQRMRRFARYWDLVANSGNFIATCDSLLCWPMASGEVSAFGQFLALSDWLYQTTNQTHAISLSNLTELLFRFMTEVQLRSAADVAPILWSDYTRVGRSDRPAFLKDFVSPINTREQSRAAAHRQARHQRQ